MTSLREVSTAGVRAVLPRAGNQESTLGAGLRFVFTVLRRQKVTFANPIARIATGLSRAPRPLPVDLALVRGPLSSPDPARAPIIALVAFHALRAGQPRTLLLTDLRDGRLHLRDRAIPLAGTARVPSPRGWPAAPGTGRRPPTRTCSSTCAPRSAGTPSESAGCSSRPASLAACRPSARTASCTRRTRAAATSSASATCSACPLPPPRYMATIDHPGLAASATPGRAGT